MNKRAIQLLMLALAAITVGSLLSPVSAPAAPIDDKQAEAAQLEQQITENGRRVDALNEQINSAQIALDDANATIVTADEQVAAASAKTKDLRAELARRAVSVYQQGRFLGRRVRPRREEHHRPRHAAQVHLARRSAREAAREPTRATRRKSSPHGRPTPRTRVPSPRRHRRRSKSTKADLVAGDNKQRELLSQVKGDIAELVAKQEAERRAADEAAARARMAADTRLRRAALATAVAAGNGARSAATAAALPRRADRPPPRAVEPGPRWRTRTRSSASPTATRASGPTASTARASR